MTSAELVPALASADVDSGPPDGVVDLVRTQFELLGDMLAAISSDLPNASLNLALPDDQQGGLACVDEIPEFFEIGNGKRARPATRLSCSRDPTLTKRG